MRKSNHHAIRMALQKYPDGLTAYEIVERIEGHHSSVRRSLLSMPDAYIDRWTASRNSEWTAVWCVVVPPENCPEPLEKFLDRTRNKSKRPSRNVCHDGASY